MLFNRLRIYQKDTHMTTLKKIICILTLSIITLGAHAGVVTYGGVTWDEDDGNPLSASFTFNQWYTTDSSDFSSMDILPVPSSLADIGAELFIFGEFTGFSSGRESQPTDNTAFTDGAELTFAISGAYWDPTNPGANAAGIVIDDALFNVYIDETRDLSQSDYTDWADANNDGDLWASFEVDFAVLQGNVADAQLFAGISIVDGLPGWEVLDSNSSGSDFFINSSAQFNTLSSTVAQGANGQMVRVPEPSILALFAFAIFGLASRRIREKF